MIRLLNILIPTVIIIFVLIKVNVIIDTVSYIDDNVCYLIDKVEYYEDVVCDFMFSIMPSEY